MPDLKDYIAKRKMAHTMGEWQVLDLVERKVTEKMEALKEAIKGEIRPWLDNHVKTLLNAKLRGEKGEKGQQGYTPRKGVDYYTPGEIKRVIEEIAARFRQPKDGADGKTPTKSELKRIILPLIPEINEAYIIEKLKSHAKPEIIREIVKEAKPEQKITIGDVEGLQQLISILNQNIATLKSRKPQAAAAGGGGMGNWSHEQFSGDDSTTEFTLSNNVAAGGTAILVRYYGQLMAHNSQYTISGKVVTFTFTPDSGQANNIDITYVRS